MAWSQWLVLWSSGKVSGSDLIRCIGWFGSDWPLLRLGSALRPAERFGSDI